MSNVVFYGNNRTSGASFYYVGPQITIATQEIDKLEARGKPWSVLKHLVAHDLVHAIDSHAATDRYSHIDNDKEFSLDGDLYKEFLAMRDKLTTPVVDIPYIEDSTV